MGTPGCVTKALWKHHLQLLERKEEVQEVELVCAPEGVPGLLLVGRDGEPTWWLRPARDAEVALRLLEDQDQMHVVQATVTAVRDRVEGAADDTTRLADAKLELRMPVTAATFGEVVDIATVGPAARRVLEEPRRNAYVFASDPWLYLPSVMRSCMERLSSPLLATAFADPGQPLRIDAFVFVGRDGLPCYEPGMEVPREATDPDLPFDQRCELLRSVSLLVGTTRGGRQQIVRLRPDRVWLWTACECTRDSARHVSRWQFERAPASFEAPVDAPTIACHMTRTENLYHRGVWDVESWLKVVATPFAAAADVVIAVVTAPLDWFVPDEHEEPPRRR